MPFYFLHFKFGKNSVILILDRHQHVIAQFFVGIITYVGVCFFMTFLIAAEWT